MPRRDLYEASLERCDYGNSFRLRFVSDWARRASDQDRAEMLQFTQEEIRRITLAQVDALRINLAGAAIESQIISPEAREKSMQLLIRNLTPAQRQEFERNHHFNVKVRDHTFQIDTRSTFNVTDLATGVRYCTRSAEPVPIYDLMLAQKLMLEVDPDSFFAVANADNTLARGPLTAPEIDRAQPVNPAIRIEPRQEIRDQNRPRNLRRYSFAPW